MNERIKSHQPSYIDTHCHIDLYPEPEKVIGASEARHICTIAVTNAPSVFTHTAELVRNCRYVRPAVGLHPQLVASRSTEIHLMWPILEQTRYVGEVGLDYSQPEKADRARQLAVFSQILERCAIYGNKVFTIHSRRAEADVISAIGSNYPGRIILHWYSGPIRELERAVSNGLYFSVNSAMSSSDRGRSLIMRMPINRVLTETDGPLVMTGQLPSTPADVPSIVDKLAALWMIDPGQARAKIAANFRRLLNTESHESIDSNAL